MRHPAQHSELIRIERERVGHFYYRFPRGESGADVYDRVSTFMDSVNRCYRHDPVRFDNVVLVSHGLTTRLFLMRFFHWDVETFESMCVALGAAAVVAVLRWPCLLSPVSCSCGCNATHLPERSLHTQRWAWLPQL